MTALPGLHLGQTVLVSCDEDEDAEQVAMRVDVVQDGQFTLATLDDVPIGEFETISHVDPVVLTYVDRFSVYTAEVHVLRQGETRLVCAVPEELHRIQRRMYARVHTPVAASCLLLDSGSASFTPFDAVVRDIGGGGLACSADAIAPEGATLVLALQLPDGVPLVVVGTVLAPDPAMRASGQRRTTRVEFTLIKEADRDRVMRFVLLCLAGRAQPN